MQGEENNQEKGVQAKKVLWLHGGTPTAQNNNKE
jgi:hypothetical protein